MDGSEQDCSKSITDVLELLQSCTAINNVYFESYTEL